MSNAILYRIYTQDTPEYRANALRIVATYFSAFTVIYTKGYWESNPEDSLIIEVLSSASYDDIIHDVATSIKLHNKQDAVLITQTPITSELF